MHFCFLIIKLFVCENSRYLIFQLKFTAGFLSDRNKNNDFDFVVVIIMITIILQSRLCLQELEDSFNYGLFQPPLNGRAGKFLDEERRLAEYPFQASVGHLEVRTELRVTEFL